MTIIYNIDKNKKKLKIFGEDFVKNNKNNCYLLINGKKIDLCKEIMINEEKRRKNILEIKLIETKIITNMSYMFYDCNSLQSLPDICEWTTKYVNNMSCMFSGCKSLQSLPDISKWDTKNVIDMSWMFSWCNSLQSLPVISNWNTKNVINMNSMFNGCSSLKSLPDFSKWNINKKLKRESMFDGVDKKLIPKKFQGCLIY